MKEELLSRKEFKQQVFKRDKGKCIFCSEEAIDAHHIIDRSLFKDGGYYLSNGVSVCSKHHWDCEKGIFSPEGIRKAAKIEKIVLPPGFDYNKRYDKFGKEF